MNERIQELARQADPDYTGNADDDMGNALVGNEAIEKFAELIVKVCIDICKDVNRNPYLEDEYQARQIIKNIEKHFGVER